MLVWGLHWLVGGYSADVLNIIKEKVFFLLFNKSFLKPSFAVWDLGRLVDCVTLHLFFFLSFFLSFFSFFFSFCFFYLFVYLFFSFFLFLSFFSFFFFYEKNII